MSMCRTATAPAIIIILFAVATVNGRGESNTSSRSQQQHIALGRGARLMVNDRIHSRGASSSLNILDTSQWLAQESSSSSSSSMIQVNGIPVEYEEKGNRVSSATTLVASVRTKRRKSFGITTTTEESEDESSITMDPLVIDAISKPFVPKSIWSRLRGTEFDQPGTIDDLVKTGLSMTSSSSRDPNEWITWKSYKNKNDNNKDNADGGTATTTDDDNDDQNDAADSDDDDSIRVYVGKCGKANADDYYGANLPMIRTEAVIRNMTPAALADLLLDSSRVQVYNKMSIGRTDVRSVTSCETGISKIVRNLTQPPLTKKLVESTTLMHARQLTTTDNKPGAYLVVSRAVPSSVVVASNDNEQQYGKSEILLGVNLLEPHDDDATSLKITCVTHVYSPAIPVVLAKRVGVTSAIGFIKDIRSVAASGDE